MERNVYKGDSIFVASDYWDGTHITIGWYIIGGTIFEYPRKFDGRHNHHIGINKNDRIRFRKAVLFEKFLLPFNVKSNIIGYHHNE
jgi:hypothetical protein